MIEQLNSMSRHGNAPLRIGHSDASHIHRAPSEYYYSTTISFVVDILRRGRELEGHAKLPRLPYAANSERIKEMKHGQSTLFQKDDDKRDIVQCDIDSRTI